MGGTKKRILRRVGGRSLYHRGAAGETLWHVRPARADGNRCLPTLCDFAGIVPPTKLPGLSLRSALDGSAEAALSARRYIVSSNHFAQAVAVLGIKRAPAGRMLRSTRYKYCVYDQGEHRESLVDMENDPGELVNLVGNTKLARL